MSFRGSQEKRDTSSLLRKLSVKGLGLGWRVSSSEQELTSSVCL